MIFAMGGGGFTMEPTNPLLDDFVLSLAARREPRILFLPTASGDTTAQINAFKARFADRTCVPEHAVAVPPARDHAPARGDRARAGHRLRRRRLDAQPARASGAPTGSTACSSKRGSAGTVLAGLSAGAMCWFQGGVTRSSGPPEPIAGLGLLEGSLTVHADGEPERLPVWLASVRDGTLPGGWALDDGVGLLFRGSALERAVSSRPGARRPARRRDRRRARAPAPRRRAARRRRPAAALGGLDEAVEELRRVHRLRRGARGAAADEPSLARQVGAVPRGRRRPNADERDAATDPRGPCRRARHARMTSTAAATRWRALDVSNQEANPA